MMTSPVFNNGITFLGVIYFLASIGFAVLLTILVIKAIQALNVYIKRNS
jgi:hypothetical protein